MNNYQKVIAASILLFAALLVGCQKTLAISDINRDPGRYADQDIKIAGHVSNSFAAFGTGLYQIDDGTGNIWVYSQNGVPSNGATVIVTGRVQQGFSLGGRSYATILRETEPRR